MPNPEKWRPFVLALAAAAVIATSFIWRTNGGKPAAQATDPRRQVKSAVKLLQSIQQSLPTIKAELRPTAYSLYAQLANQIYLLQKVGPNAKHQEVLLKNIEQIAGGWQKVADGQDPLAGKTGMLIRGYVSTLGGIQGYTISVPDNYSPTQKLPLIVSLQAGGNSDRWNFSLAPQHPSAICVAPRGFGQPDFKYQAEEDALEVIRDVMQNYAIDPNRIYLVGGAGAWSLAVHHPDLFAAVAPVAAFTGVQLAAGDQQQADGTIRQAVDFARSAAAAYSFAGNLLNVPVYAMHGGSDSFVPAASSQKMVEAIRQAGNKQVVYHQFPGFDHGAFPSAFIRERNAWLLKQRKNPEPLQVRYRTASLRYPRAYWLLIENRPNQLEFSDIAGKVSGESLKISVSNVSRFQIKTPSPLLKSPEISVTVNDSIAYKGKPAPVLVFEQNHEGWQRVDTTQPQQSVAKRPGLCGPVDDAFLSPFLLVGGDGAGPEQTSGALMSTFLQWRRQMDIPQITPDKLTQQELKLYNLVLFGNPQTNSLMAKLMKNLPIRIEGDTITCGDKVYRGSDLGVIFCYPNPLNPARYVVIYASTGYDGMLGITSRFGNWFAWPSLKGRNWFDYAIFDNKTFGPGSFLDVGFFGSNWQLDAKTRWQRDPAGNYQQRIVPTLASINAAPAEFALSQLRPIVYWSQAGPIAYDQRSDGSKLLPDADRRGIAMNAPASIGFRLVGKAREITFTPYVPPQTNGKAGPPVQFVMLDEKGNVLYDSGLVKPGEKLQPVTKLLHGVNDLALEVKTTQAAEWFSPQAIWLDLRVKKAGQSKK